MLENFYRKNKDLLDKALIISLFVLFIYLFVKVLFYYVAPFVIGYVLSLAFHPPVSYFHKKHKINRGISTIFLISFSLLILATLGTTLMVNLSYEVKSFFNLMPNYIEQMNQTFANMENRYNMLVEFIPKEFESILKTAFSNIFSSLTSSLSGAVQQSSFEVVGSIPSFFLSFILCLISAYFFTKDKYKINSFLFEASPVWLSDNIQNVKTGLLHSAVGYLKAQLILMCITATICVVGLSLIRFPYALLIGLTASLIDALPIFGVGFILWPLALINLLSGNYMVSIQLMVIYLVVIVTRQLNEPKILGDQIGLHPLLTLMSMYVGLKVFGVLGFIIGPMMLIVSKVIYTADTNE